MTPARSPTMSEATVDQDKAIAATTARLESALREARKGEAKLKRVLEMRRLRRLVEAKRFK